MNKKVLILTIISIFIDQLIKYIIKSSMILGESIVIFDFFKLTYVHNYGAAFSILSGNRYLLIIITIIAMFFIYKFLIKNQKLTNLESALYGFLYGGIIGNLIDRVFLGCVIDYLDFKILGYDFAIFNFADILIVVSIILLVITVFKDDKNGKN